MRLYRYQNFIKESKKDIESICKKYNIQNYTINEDGSVDVDGNVNLVRRKLTELPLKFGKVSGFFYCNDNQLESLSGAPLEVGGDFYCPNNKLKSLSGAPREVSGDFDCHMNILTNLEGSPREVSGDFVCYDNKLISLSGAPNKVGGHFICDDNNLTTLEGISKYISGNINCQMNQLRDVKGVKDGWRGQFFIGENPVQKIFKLFPKNRRDEVIEYLNEYEVIRDGKVVVLQALELVFHEMGLEVPEIEHIKGYEIQY
jgi:hypothetical protein